MRDDYCFLCASDEGVFLDVYSDPKFLGKIKCCLTSKYSDKDSISSNVCYKCAFEVNQCSEFVNKYKLSRKTHGLKKKPANACSLCLEPGVDGQIFDLVKERHSTNDPIRKIQTIFQNDLSKSQSLLVCITCRYCLDVLYDLKLVYETMSTNVKDLIVKGNKNVKIPKTKTQVITRKTTTNVRQQKGVHLMSDSDSDSSTATVRRTRRNNNGPSQKKNRQCEKCETLVENGVDMFRFHRTGLTVCKDCWIKEEPAGKSTERKRSNSKNTKKCSVFLKDVFDNDASLYKIEKDEFGNTTYIITDEGSESEERPAKRMRNQDTNNKEIKQFSLRGRSNKLTKSQSQTERSSSEESLSPKTRIKTESFSDGENRTRRGKRKLSPDVEVLVEFTRSKRKRASPTSSVTSNQFKSPTSKKSETKNTRKRTKITEIKKEEESKLEGKRGRPKKQTKNTDKIIEIKEEVDEIQGDEEEIKVDDHEDQSYECKQCGLEFDVKSDKVNHLMTHSKNMTLKLHRVITDKSATSTESENEGEIVENESNLVSQDEPTDVVKISKANENNDIDIEGNETVEFQEQEDSNSKTDEEEEATKKAEENFATESVEKTKNEEEKQDESDEESAKKDEETENDKSLEKEEKDECINEKAVNEKSENEKVEAAETKDDQSENENEEAVETNVNNESKSTEEENTSQETASEKNEQVSTPVEEVVENNEKCSNTEKQKDVEIETNKAKESDSDSVDLHLSQSSTENGSVGEHINESTKTVVGDDESACDEEAAPVNGCTISKDKEELQGANETEKSTNASNVPPLDSAVENNEMN